MSYEGPWRNRPFHLYTQFCFLHEAEALCNPKLLKLLEKYGVAFDDNWQYKLTGRTQKVVIRKPLWLDTSESGKFAEKPRIHDPAQAKLKDFIG